MTFALVAITYRSPRRLRLSFSDTVGSGAFSANRYTVTSDDALGVSPSVAAALLVPDSPQAVELAIGSDLADDASYTVAYSSVPDTGANTATGTVSVRTPGGTLTPSTGFTPIDVGAQLYGIDLVWDGSDFVEASTGDLATVSGLDNVQGAIERLTEADGLPWDVSYGANLREFVDGTPGALAGMRTKLAQAILADDRVRSVRVTVNPPTDDGQASVDVSVTLIGNNQVTVQAGVQS